MFSLIRCNGLNPTRRLICFSLLRDQLLNCSSFHSYFLFSTSFHLYFLFIPSYSGVISFLKAARRVGVKWIRAFPSCSFSLSCITMKVQQTESASAVHHIVNARRFLSSSTSRPLRRSLFSRVSLLIPSLTPILSVMKHDSIRLTFRECPVPPVTVPVFVASATASHFPRSTQGFRERKIRPRRTPSQRTDRVFASVVWSTLECKIRPANRLPALYGCATPQKPVVPRISHQLAPLLSFIFKHSR